MLVYQRVDLGIYSKHLEGVRFKTWLAFDFVWRLGTRVPSSIRWFIFIFPHENCEFGGICGLPIFRHTQKKIIFIKFPISVGKTMP